VEGVELFGNDQLEWATDGSEARGEAGYGLCTKGTTVDGITEGGGVEMHHKLGGKQTINRAEAMAVLHSILVSREQNPLTLFVDSQTTIDSSEKLMHDTISPRMYKDMANYSIFRAITSIRKQKLAANPMAKVSFVKVRSHTKNTDHGSNMNRRADTLAEKGRVEGDVAMHEPMMFCAPATIRIGGILEENDWFGRVYTALDAWRLSRSEGMQSASPRLKQTKMEGVWTEASVTRGRNDARKMFVFNLLYRCLPTPRGIQVSNERYPRLYEDSMCPLCREGVGNEHHIMCCCPNLREHRAQVFEKLKQSLAKVVGPRLVGNTASTLIGVMFPQEEEDFKYGKTPTVLLDIIQQHIDTIPENTLRDTPRKGKPIFYAKGIRTDVSNMYFTLWEMYRSELVLAKKTLKDRLRDEYGLTVWQLSAAHRKAVARRRTEVGGNELR
jgi:ribonuclease HI